MRGGDNKAGFAIRDPSGIILVPYKWQQNVEHEQAVVSLAGNFLTLSYFFA
jgi:hypothetical protein